MNLREHLLVCLGEEAAEVVQDVSKSLRFGLDDVNVLAPDGPTNRERLVTELNQLFAVIELLQVEGALPVDFLDREIIEAKKAKVAEFVRYAREKGALQCP